MDEVQVTGVAAAKVFSTFELLENILIGLANIDIRHPVIDRAKRIRDLYRFQRVNSTFRHLIARSKALQLLMFKIESDEAQHDQSSNHTDDNASKMERLLNLNPLTSTLPWFGIPLRHKGDFFRDFGPAQGDAHYLKASLVIKESTIKELKASKPGPSPWRKMVIASKPTAFSVIVVPEVPMWTEGQWFLPPHVIFNLEKGATLGRFVDLIIGEIVDCGRS